MLLILNLIRKISILPIVMLACLHMSCNNRKSHEQSRSEYVIDTTVFLQTPDPILKVYEDERLVEVTRMYEDSARKELATFYLNGNIKQYVFFNEECDCGKFIINYDSSGVGHSYDGKLAYLKSEIFGKSLQLDSTYSIHLFCATPPKMIVDVQLYTSSNEENWKLYGEDEFYEGRHGSTITDTASLDDKFGMGICVLRGNSGKKEILKSDTIRYSLNIEN